MVKSSYVWAVSAQPWPEGSAADLAAMFARLGFDGAEIPVRDGFPVNPGNVSSQLAEWSRVFADQGLKVTSVTGEVSAELFDAAAANGIPVIRVMAPIGGDDYVSGVRQLQRKFAGWEERCRATGIRLAVQQHHGPFISTTPGLTALLAPLSPEAVGAAWDAAHSGLAGEVPAFAVSEIVDRLEMVNLRNAHYGDPEGGEWPTVWVAGSDGMSDWAAVAAALRATPFSGTICLAAQYSKAIPDIASAVGRDLEYAKSLFES